MTKLSIIIPIYGVEAYIERCATSLFDQQLEEVEYLFIDDCTPDNSIAVLSAVIDRNRQRIAERHWVVRIERMPVNSGLPAVRRRGVELATGEYIAHCDSDDWVMPDIYTTLYTTAKAGNYDAVFCDHLRHSETHSVAVATFPHKHITKQQAFDSLYANNTGYHSIWCALYRASLYSHVQEYPTANMGEDSALTAQLLYYANQIAYLPTPLYCYRQRQGSIVQTTDPSRLWNNAKQLEENQRLILRFFSHVGLPDHYLTFAKLTARFGLIPLRHSNGFKQAWHQLFPEIEGHIVGNRHIPLRLQIKYLLLTLRLLP